MYANAVIAGSSTAPQSAGMLLAGYNTVPLPPDIRARIVAAAITRTANGPTGNAYAPALKIK